MLARRLALALVAALSCPGCAAPGADAPAPRFVFQDHFWVNLHHGLRAEARRRDRGAELELPLDALAAGEREAWVRALDAYRSAAQRSLLFDAELVRIHVALAAFEGESLPAELAGPELTAALNAAAPVFRAHVWPARSQVNEGWIARTRPAVERLAATVTDAMAAACEQEWPAAPVLVDVTPDTGPTAGYTTNEAPPGFAGLATLNPSLEAGSPAAIECVFHEAAHVIDATFVRWVEEASAVLGVEPPSDLWHAFLFYTAGELTRRALGEPGTFREDLERGFPGCLPALDEHWRPYLEGERSRAEAVLAVVRAVVAARSASPQAER